MKTGRDGGKRLEHDVEVVGRMLDHDVPPAGRRLQALLGGRLADRLVASLTFGACGRKRVEPAEEQTG